MVAVSYSFDSQDFDDMEFFINVIEAPATGEDIFWAHQFWFNGGDGGYVGLQTNGYITEPVGKMIIFSIWDAENGVPGEGATCLTFGGEGLGWSCRLPFAWEEGHDYRLQIAYEGESWWGASLEDVMGDQGKYIGRIKVPGQWGQLIGASVNFTEVYGSVPDCSEIGYAVATFNHPVAGEGTSLSTPENPRTYGICASYADVGCSVESCFHVIGWVPGDESMLYLPFVVK